MPNFVRNFSHSLTLDITHPITVSDVINGIKNTPQFNGVLVIKGALANTVLQDDKNMTKEEKQEILNKIKVVDIHDIVDHKYAGINNFTKYCNNIVEYQGWSLENLLTSDFNLGNVNWKRYRITSSEINNISKKIDCKIWLLRRLEKVLLTADISEPDALVAGKCPLPKSLFTREKVDGKFILNFNEIPFLAYSNYYYYYHFNFNNVEIVEKRDHPLFMTSNSSSMPVGCSDIYFHKFYLHKFELLDAFLDNGIKVKAVVKSVRNPLLCYNRLNEIDFKIYRGRLTVHEDDDREAARAIETNPFLKDKMKSSIGRRKGCSEDEFLQKVAQEKAELNALGIETSHNFPKGINYLTMPANPMRPDDDSMEKWNQVIAWLRSHGYRNDRLVFTKSGGLSKAFPYSGYAVRDRKSYFEIVADTIGGAFRVTLPKKEFGDFNISTGGELTPAYGEYGAIVDTGADVHPTLRAKDDSPLKYKYMSLEDVYRGASGAADKQVGD